MIRMTNKARKAAHSLAVRYAAFTELADDVAAKPDDLMLRDRLGIWAGMLKIAQADVGVELIFVSSLDAAIARGREAREARWPEIEA